MFQQFHFRVHTPELKAPWPEWYLRPTSVVCNSQQWKGGGKCPLTHHAQPYADTMQPNSASEAQEVLIRVTTQPDPEDFMLEVTQQKDKSHLAARLWSTQGQSNSQRHKAERWLPEAAGGRNGESFSHWVRSFRLKTERGEGYTTPATYSMPTSWTRTWTSSFSSST